MHRRSQSSGADPPDPTGPTIAERLGARAGGAGGAYRTGATSYHLPTPSGERVATLTDIAELRVSRSATEELPRGLGESLRWLLGRPTITHALELHIDLCEEGGVMTTTPMSEEALRGLAWTAKRGRYFPADLCLELLDDAAAAGKTRVPSGRDTPPLVRRGPKGGQVIAWWSLLAVVLAVVVAAVVWVARCSWWPALVVSLAGAIGFYSLMRVSSIRSLAKSRAWSALAALTLANLYTLILAAPAFWLARRAGARWEKSPQLPTSQLAIGAVTTLVACCFLLGYVWAGYGFTLTFFGDAAKAHVIEQSGNNADGGDVVARLTTRSGRVITVAQGFSNSEPLPEVGRGYEVRYWPNQPRLNTKPNRCEAALAVPLVFWVPLLIVDWSAYGIFRRRFGLGAVLSWPQTILVFVGRYLSAVTFGWLWWSW